MSQRQGSVERTLRLPQGLSVAVWPRANQPKADRLSARGLATPRSHPLTFRSLNLEVLARIHPDSGGFLEAMPFASFLVMSLLQSPVSGVPGFWTRGVGGGPPRSTGRQGAARQGFP